MRFSKRGGIQIRALVGGFLFVNKYGLSSLINLGLSSEKKPFILKYIEVCVACIFSVVDNMQVFLPAIFVYGYRFGIR